MKHISTILAAAMALTAASSAGATPFTVTYIGTVTGDIYGNFFGNGQSAVGDAYSETFVLDPTTAGAITYNSPGYNYTYGSYDSNPVLSDILTIAGQIISAPDPSSSQYGFGEDAQLSNYSYGYNQAYDYQYTYDQNGYKYSYQRIYNYNLNPMVPATYGGNGTYTVQPGDSAYGYFYEYDNNLGLSRGVDLAPTEVIFGAGAVPEPATWALMLTGFGFVGTMLRRRKIDASLQYA